MSDNRYPIIPGGIAWAKNIIEKELFPMAGSGLKLNAIKLLREIWKEAYNSGYATCAKEANPVIPHSDDYERGYADCAEAIISNAEFLRNVRNVNKR